jgi:hypothetical protein
MSYTKNWPLAFQSGQTPRYLRQAALGSGEFMILLNTSSLTQQSPIALLLGEPTRYSLAGPTIASWRSLWNEGMLSSSVVPQPVSYGPLMASCLICSRTLS